MTVSSFHIKANASSKSPTKTRGENGKEKGGCPALWGFPRDVHDTKLSFADFFSLNFLEPIYVFKVSLHLFNSNKTSSNFARLTLFFPCGSTPLSLYKRTHAHTILTPPKPHPPSILFPVSSLLQLFHDQVGMLC